MTSNEAKKSIGQEIIEGLTELSETIREGTPLHEKFTIHDVHDDELRSKAHDIQRKSEVRDGRNN